MPGGPATGEWWSSLRFIVDTLYLNLTFPHLNMDFLEYKRFLKNFWVAVWGLFSVVKLLVSGQGVVEASGAKNIC